MLKPPYRRVAVVGVGLIGGSVALALRRHALAGEVVGVVRTEQRVRQAIACGAVEHATTNLGEACRDADVVVIASPVSLIAELARDAASHLGAGRLVTDVGSTKASLVADLGHQWPRGGDAPYFVGAHPMAGDHRSGPEAARGDLFDEATTVVTPVESTPADALGSARAFWEAVGSRVVEFSPEEHDRLVALASHVPHVAAAALAATTPEDALQLAATGWADTTRVASGPEALWRDILLANRSPVAAGLRGLASELEAYATALDAADGDALQRQLEAGRRRRDALGN